VPAAKHKNWRRERFIVVLSSHACALRLTTRNANVEGTSLKVDLQVTQRPTKDGEVLFSELNGESQPTGSAALTPKSAELSRSPFRDLSTMLARNVDFDGVISID
jgi:hypothetical protein